MTGILLIGGKAPHRKNIASILERADFVVAADSGFDLAGEYGVIPDLLVGDMDSVNRTGEYGRFPDEKMRIYPEDKDETDTEIGLTILFEKGCGERILIGGGEGRLAHTLGIIAIFERNPHPDSWYTERESIISIEEYAEFETYPGQHVSLFPLGTEECTMSSRGLKWELDGLRWSRGDFGLSNRAVSDWARITVKTGRLLMIKEFGGEQ